MVIRESRHSSKRELSRCLLPRRLACRALHLQGVICTRPLRDNGCRLCSSATCTMARPRSATVLATATAMASAAVPPAPHRAPLANDTKGTIPPIPSMPRPTSPHHHPHRIAQLPSLARCWTISRMPAVYHLTLPLRVISTSLLLLAESESETESGPGPGAPRAPPVHH